MLSASDRLKNKKAFNDIFRYGQTFSNDVLVMKIMAARPGDATQFGFGIGLKFSKKATRRNKVRRWMREAVREKIKKIIPGHRVIFLANPKYPEEKLNFEIIQENIESLLKKAKIIQEA